MNLRNIAKRVGKTNTIMMAIGAAIGFTTTLMAELGKKKNRR